MAISIKQHGRRRIQGKKPTPFWKGKDGVRYYIPKMGDAHLFFTMENVLKVCRMTRRRRIEALEGMLEMYADAYGEERDDMPRVITKELDNIIEMNTDAFGKHFFPHYQALMTEAAKRNMRDPFKPCYEKESL